MASIWSSVVIILSVLLSLASGQCSCPSSGKIGTFSWCAADGGICNIAAEIKEGYVSYGGIGDKWVLIPFTNTANTAMPVACDGYLGDVAWGAEKCCCYTTTTTATGQPTDSLDSTNIVHEGQWQSINTMAYGTANQLVYRQMSGPQYMQCGVGYFGDPAWGFDKWCRGTDDVPTTFPAATEWINCGSEPYECNQLISNEPQWIKYGATETGKYYYKLVVVEGNTHSIPCQNQVFNDPEGDYWKHCYIKKQVTAPPTPQPTFSGVGEWVELFQQLGEAKVIKQYKVGMTEAAAKGLTESDSESMQRSLAIKLGFKVGSPLVSGEGSVDVTHTLTEAQSYTVTTSTVNTNTIQAFEITTFQCGDANDEIAFYWRTAVTESNGFQTFDFYINSNTLICLSDNRLEPQCPPKYCNDDDCQQCIEHIGA